MSLKNIPTRYIIISFGLGVVSAFVAIWAEYGLIFDTSGMLFLDPTIMTIFSAVMVAPLIEELAKPLGLYLIHGEEEPSLSLESWIFLGAVSGFGFATLENIMYASSLLSLGTDAAFTLLLLRFLLPLHMVASAVAGMGFGLWVKTRNGFYFVICMFTAMLIHALFNFSAIFVG